MLGITLDLKGLDPNINGINIYTIQVNNLFNKNNFIFLFNKVKESNRVEFIKRLQQRLVYINTLYKRKADKIRPINLGVLVDKVLKG